MNAISWRKGRLRYTNPTVIRNAVIRRLNRPLYPLHARVERTFDFNGMPFHYFAHRYNGAHLSERTIEVPIMRSFIAGKVLEVGNVLNHYFPFEHEVADKFEKADGVINCDIRDFRSESRYDRVLSISTLEHVGWDERPKESPEAFLPGS